MQRTELILMIFILIWSMKKNNFFYICGGFMVGLWLVMVRFGLDHINQIKENS